MKVYVLQEDHFDFQNLIGVVDTEDKAKAWCNAQTDYQPYRDYYEFELE